MLNILMSLFDDAMEAFMESVKLSTINAGPSVMHKNNKEGGYLLTLKKDKSVCRKSFCALQGIGSP